MRQAYRASLFHCLDDPGEGDRASACEYFEDGILVVDDARLLDAGPAAALLGQLGDTPVEDLTGRLIVPGFIDCHVHFPQLEIIGSYGTELLEWLERYAYPAEARYADEEHARRAAGFFLDELLAAGTTTAAVFATVHAHSADALFAAAEARDMRLITGKVLMDRNCPETLRDTPDSAYSDSEALIRKWHGRGRLGYAITPRFAVTSSPGQLERAGALAAVYPDAWVHTHLAENVAELQTVARLFPESDGYLDVYDRHGLVRERSLFAHCLHLSDAERRRMAAAGAACAFCPTSNLFLGSGLFDLAGMRTAEVRVGLATDVGAGTSLSMLQTMDAAYKALRLQHQALPASRAFYLATLGAARALYLDDRIGNFAVGKEADFVVVDPGATRLSARRLGSVTDAAERLFALLTLGDDRHIERVYVNGRCVEQGRLDG